MKNTTDTTLVVTLSTNFTDVTGMVTIVGWPKMGRRASDQVWQDRQNHHSHSSVGLQSRREMGMSASERSTPWCQIKSLQRYQETPDTAETRKRKSASDLPRRSLWNGGMRHPGCRRIAVLLPTPHHDPLRVLRGDVPALVHYRRTFRHHRRVHAIPFAWVSAVREASSSAGGRHVGATDLKCHTTPEMVPGTRHGRHQDLSSDGIYPALLFQKLRQRSQRQSTTRRRPSEKGHHRRYF